MNPYYASLIFLSTNLPHQAAGTAENAKKFDALCAALRAARATVTDALYLGDTADDGQPEPVRALYAATLDKAAYNGKTFGVFTDETDFKNLKERIATAKDEHNRLVYTVAADSPMKRMVNFNLYKIYNESSKIVAAISAAKKNSEALTQDARQKMAEAITGNPGKATPTKDDFEARADACTGSAQAAAGRSLAADLICVCSGTDQSADPCVKDLRDTNYIAATTAKTEAAVTAYKSIAARCPALEPNKEATPELLQTAISLFESELGNSAYTGNTGNSIHFILGQGAGATCNGADSSTICVDYTKTVGTATIAKIPWVAALTTAAAKLRQAQAGRAKLEALRAELKSQARTAWAEFGLLELQEALQSTNIKATETQPKQITDTACNKHKDSTTCQPPCKWEENAADKDKKCSLDPKEAAEQATQETGTGETQTGKKCSDRTKKEGCEAENKNVKAGEKSVCGWIEETCKDSSFLVNKKFSPINSSISLLAF
ncbi:Trypanosome variant surface glycoprotein C-terminal domain containing protein [Trypanosoma brucei equiperdum]|uniref:Trypanosome variant surface glycoprotein C-terminal domain containing protein n=1 Tax=Trypanosoma brucei equiperdum TaxID=630700 RepID=A0A3L6KZB8_9TRYP|nr:Trypanosome variant surface glycoprotein C-terminal domain containing protein [Trypanosoma brucei equiperdum]